MFFQLYIEGGKFLASKHVVHRDNYDRRGDIAQIHSLQDILTCGWLWQASTGIIVEIEGTHRHVEKDEIVLLLCLKYHLLGGIIRGAMIDLGIREFRLQEISDVLCLFLIVFYQEYSFVLTHKL